MRRMVVERYDSEDARWYIQWHSKTRRVILATRFEYQQRVLNISNVLRILAARFGYL